jgi:hypothetical protein
MEATFTPLFVVITMTGRAAVPTRKNKNHADHTPDLTCGSCILRVKREPGPDPLRRRLVCGGPDRSDAVARDCWFATFEACQPHVIAGNRGFCVQNPYWPGWYAQPAEPTSSRKCRRSRVNGRALPRLQIADRIGYRNRLGGRQKLFGPFSDAGVAQG